ncbi:HAMP domain-containing protein [Micromonospora zingiberis]|uniref:histidine kinase n=1 Tax=Micromonospora zingiberis TaxID=2053011 RepID=A0A4R0GES4_9ACTN|nr:nitrate- and nitrite sensing domain-containing protein [Micromonospora zingiberis]TCB95760.1 HAMP domain-containing protein [Micromonospora zingiberis]
MNTRDWPIRSKLTALVVVPVTALLALWIFATTLTFGPALDLLAARTLLYDLGRPGETVVAELQRERRLSVVQLASPRSGCDRQSTGCALPALREQRARTDAAVAELRRRVSGEKLRDAAGDLLEARLDRLLGELEALPPGRGSIDRRELDRVGAVALYSEMVSAAFHTFEALANLPDQDLNREARALTDLGRSRELLGQTDALLAGALTGGGFAKGEHTMLVQNIGNQWFLAETAVADLPEPDQAAYHRLTEQEGFERLRAMQDDLIAAGPSARPTVDAAAWQASYDTVQQSLRDFELTQADGLADRSVPMAVRTLARLAGAGLLGLVAVVVSLVVALRVGRSLAQRLTLMRGTLTETAEKRLPDVVARLRRGEQVDVARETPVADRGADEIGQVAQAFTEVQKVAIEAAQVEVTLRRGLNEVFLNIARRSQGLVHRQLALLDRLERDAEDPDHLAELFQVDHLATRLRRHAEDLVILAGATSGRGWRDPVAMVDLIRGAISEVESYDRVEITSLQPAGTVGRVVGDIIHLLAELIENATTFSPPDSRVEVSGQHVANGYALSVSDQGLGMTAAAIEEANRKLAEAPEFDPAETARLGLFVVARLAARHGVRVRLRRSDGSGMTAVVLIPTDLITAEPSPLLALEASGSGDDTAPEQRRLVRATRLTTVPRPRTRSAGRSATSGGPQPPGGSAAKLGGPRQSSTVEPAESDGLPRRIRRRPPAGSTTNAVPTSTTMAPGFTAGPGSTADLARGSTAGSVPGSTADPAGGSTADPASGSPAELARGSGGAVAIPADAAPAGRTAQPPAGRDRPTVDTPTVRLPALTSRPAGSTGIDGPTLRQPVVTPRRTPGPVGEPTPRSPEEARRFMSALQSGTARGRLAADTHVAGGPPPAATSPAGAELAGGPPTAATSAGRTGPAEQSIDTPAGGPAPANQDPINEQAGPPPGGPATVESPTATERDA